MTYACGLKTFLLFAKLLVFFFAKKPSLGVWAVAPLDVGEQYIKAAFTMQFLEVQRERTQGQTWLDAFFVQNHCKFYKKFIEMRKFNWKYRHIGKNLEYYTYSLLSKCNYSKFNERTQGQIWLDVFFVQNHCKIHRKFNWKYIPTIIQ